MLWLGIGRDGKGRYEQADLCHLRGIKINDDKEKVDFVRTVISG